MTARSAIAGLLAVSMMLATLVAGAVTAPFAAYADNGASPSGTPGLCTPTVGTMGDSSSDINASDTGVATYVGGDMIVGKRTGANTMRNGDGANGGGPDGSYAAEIEGATVVNGDLYAKPRKGFFTAGLVAFGSQFVPAQGTQVLTVGGNTKTSNDAKPSSGSHAFAWKDSESPKLSDKSRSVVGISDNAKLKADDTATTDYTASIKGDKYYLYGKADITDQNEKEKYASVVPYSGTSDHAQWNVPNPLKNVAGLDNGADSTTTDSHDFTGYGDYLKTLSTQMKDYKGTSEMTVDSTGTLGNVDPNDSSSTKYTRYKYNWNNDKKEISYRFEFDSKLNEKLITFHGDGKSALQVFTIKASDLTTADGQTGISYKFENIPDNTSVVVNVTGTSVRFHNGWRFLWQAPGEDKATDLSNGYWNPGSNGTPAQKAYEDYAERASKILWNFPDATSVTILGGQASGTMKSQNFVKNSSAGWETSALETDDDPAAAMMGSILVPNGSLESHVSTNGRVWVGGDFSMYNPTAAHYPGQPYNKFENSAGQTTASVIDMDQERHNLPWSGNYTSQCASLEWTKVDTANPNTALAGSSWAVYKTRQDAENGVNPLKLVTDNEPAVDLNGKDGVIKVGGLNPEATYYVKEIGAPSGYTPSDTVYMVTSGKEGTTVTVTQDADGNEAAADGKIGNTKIGPSVTWEKTDATGGDTLAGSSWTLTRKGDATAGGTAKDESWTVKDNTVKPTIVNVYRGAGDSADLTNPVSDLTMNMGETLDLTTKVLPDAALQKVIWKSDTPDYRNILRIDLNDDGTSTAYAVGPGVVDAQVCTVAETGATDPGAQVCKHVTVTVSANIADVTDFHVRHGNAEIGDGGTIALRAGKTAQLSVTATDADGNAVTPTYESYAANVATVSADGLITAIADGTATIVVKAGNQTRVFAVEVSSTDPVQYTYIYFPASGEGVWGSADMWVHYGADGDTAWQDSDHMTAATCDGNWKVARIPRVTAGNVRFGFQRTGDDKAWYGKQGGGDFTFPANAEAVTVSGGSMTAGYPSVACSAVRPTALRSRGHAAVTAVADETDASVANVSVANVSVANVSVANVADTDTIPMRDDVDADAGEFKVIDLADGTYWLKEATAPDGYTLNPTVWQFTVSGGRVTGWNGGWVDGDTSKPIDSAVVPGAGNAISDMPKPVDITLPVKKTVSNTAWPTDSTGGAFVPFTFRISSTDAGAPIPEGCNGENGKSSGQLPCVITVTPAAGSTDRTATATFGKLTFDQSALADAVGDGGDYAKTYTYRVTEVTPSAADRVPNLRYSKAEYKVEVTVKRASVDGMPAGLTATAVITRVTDDSGKTEANGGVKVDEITIASTDKTTSGTISAATFTNTKVLTGLPATGADWTGRLVLLIGGGFILAGLIAAGTYYVVTHRRGEEDTD